MGRKIGQKDRIISGAHYYFLSFPYFSPNNVLSLCTGSHVRNKCMGSCPGIFSPTDLERTVWETPHNTVNFKCIQCRFCTKVKICWFHYWLAGWIGTYVAPCLPTYAHIAMTAADWVYNLCEMRLHVCEVTLRVIHLSYIPISWNISNGFFLLVYHFLLNKLFFHRLSLSNIPTVSTCEEDKYKVTARTNSAINILLTCHYWPRIESAACVPLFFFFSLPYIMSSSRKRRKRKLYKLQKITLLGSSTTSRVLWCW